MTSSYPVIKGTLVSTENYTWNTADSLGKGASAMVYLGRHKANGQVVAVKAFHNHLVISKTEDFRELELLRQLEHPNIIRLEAIEKTLTTSRTVIVMEYCEGGSLHHMLDQPPHYYGLAEDEYLLVLGHVSSGMQYLRSRNVIHRDIKPGNIMRFISGDGFSIYKLTDFGAARNLEEEESFQSLYGTEEYLHPGIYERAVLKLPTSESFDAKVDLWSLGVTFYHTATGQLPFQPYGGRSNRQKMFEIITQKESGVISGVQNFENGPINWKRDLPETSPLSSGLKSIVVPLLAGLMEPDSAKMITYDSLFRIVKNIEAKMTINVFHYGRCEDLKIYVESTTKFSGLQDQIASLTDILASDQILLVGGKALDEVIDPLLPVQNYPPHILHDSIYLFQREKPESASESSRLPKPEIPSFPDFSSQHVDIDADARLAHNCSARAELIKRYTTKVCNQQERLMDGLLCFRVYVESRLLATKLSQDFMGQLMKEYKFHYDSFNKMTGYLRNATAAAQPDHPDLRIMDNLLSDKVIAQVHEKACERLEEIDQYREILLKKLADLKGYATKFSAECCVQQCVKKINHKMSIISGVQSRFRRDKSVKSEMTAHDEKIHHFEREKLHGQCINMKSILIDHCFPHLEKIFSRGVTVCDSLSKCLSRVTKIEKNINSVHNCQKLLSEKLIKLRESCTGLRLIAESGFVSGGSASRGSVSGGLSDGLERTYHAIPEMESTAAEAERRPVVGMETGGVSELARQSFTAEVRQMSLQSLQLQQKLQEVQAILSENSDILRSFEENPLQSTGSMSKKLTMLQEAEMEANT